MNKFENIWNFTKMHGIGNDFIVLDAINQLIHITPKRVRLLANRNFGIGADQILLVEKAINPSADFRYRIFNSDGMEVENCGNGARCFAKFIYDQKLSNKDLLRVEIKNNVILLKSDFNKETIVNMGKISFDPLSLPFYSNKLESKIQSNEKLWIIENNDPSYDFHHVTFSISSISNPHAVIITDDINKESVQKIGSFLQSHKCFPNSVNVGFMKIKDRNSIQLRVYERGVGETLSCGTGACAAAASGIRLGLLDSPVSICMRGGKLSVSWKENENLYMTGPAVSVFHGSINIENLENSL
ncbi:MAG: diaminopimelate epimerase [Bordetella sp.]|nr:MAG: diaminopimelate epimerase [Bordetella sp.]